MIQIVLVVIRELISFLITAIIVVLSIPIAISSILLALTIGAYDVVFDNWFAFPAITMEGTFPAFVAADPQAIEVISPIAGLIGWTLLAILYVLGKKETET